MKEIRTASIEASDGLTLEGWPVVYDTPTVIHTPDGDYTEVIHRGALDSTDISDSTLIVNHDSTRIPLARSGRTMRLEVTDRGLHMLASLAGDSTQAREVVSAVRRGDMTGLSFAFTVPEGGSSFDGATNTRHIRSIAKIYEISLTPHPAYPQASVEARDQMRAARDMAKQAISNRINRIRALASVGRILH